MKETDVIRAVLRAPVAALKTANKIRIAPIGLPNAKSLKAAPPTYMSIDVLETVGSGGKLHRKNSIIDSEKEGADGFWWILPGFKPGVGL